jgi:hypothetical protein
VAAAFRDENKKQNKSALIVCSLGRVLVVVCVGCGSGRASDGLGEASSITNPLQYVPALFSKVNFPGMRETEGETTGKGALD